MQDGTYRDDYEDGGSKVKDRTFPVMYLHTNEFGWIPNYDLVDLDFDEVLDIPATVGRDLYTAHQLAAEQHDLDYFKDLLKSFIQMKEAERAQKEADKAAKKAKKAAPWTSIPDPAVLTVDQVLFGPGTKHSEATGSGVGEISIDLPLLDSITTTDRDGPTRDHLTTMSRDSGYASGISHKILDHGRHNLKVPSGLQLAMPAPLIGNSDLDMVKLASSISCQFCGKTGPLNSGAPIDQWHPGPGENESVPIWAFNISSCGACLQSRCIKELDPFIWSLIPLPLISALPFVYLTNELHVIPSATISLGTAEYPVGIQITKCFLRQHVKELQREFIEEKDMESAVTEEWLEKLHTRSRARVDDTARWERWQASGGLARLRALQNVETQPVQKGSSISECDVQSVASIQSRITDLTMSSINPAGIGGAAEEVADLLAESTDVRELISKGFKIMEADRFERNFMRLLKDFAINLRKEATDEVQKGATKLVHSYRAYVTRLIRKRFVGQKDEWQAEALHDIQKQESSKLMLERLISDVGTSIVETLDQDQESNNGSGFSEDEQALPNLKKVKDFMVLSTAFEVFRRSLHDFINPVSTLRLDEIQTIESVPVPPPAESSNDLALVDSQMADSTTSREEDHPMLEVLPEPSTISEGADDPIDICNSEQSASNEGFIIQPTIPIKKRGDEIIVSPPKKQKCDDLEVPIDAFPMDIPGYTATEPASVKFARPSADGLSQGNFNDSAAFEVAFFDHSPQPTSRNERLERIDGFDDPSTLSAKEAQDFTHNNHSEYETLAASTEPRRPPNSFPSGRLSLLKISRGIGNRFRRLWRPKVGSDSQRIEWMCVSKVSARFQIIESTTYFFRAGMWTRAIPSTVYWPCK
jgi:hypothetical protein